MAIEQETGTGSATANSYVTVADYDAYLDARYPSRTAITTAQAEAYIFRAMDYFENLNFQGRKNSEAQALQWPRAGVCIDGFGVDSNEIPSLVLTAVYELAYGFEQGYCINDPVGRETASEAVGALNVTYKNSSAERTLLPAATQALRKLLINGNRVVRV